jgi:hypothetical protein
VFALSECSHIIAVHGLDESDWSSSSPSSSSNVLSLGTPASAFYRQVLRAPDAVAGACNDDLIHVGIAALDRCDAKLQQQARLNADHAAPGDVVLIAKQLAHLGVAVDCESATSCRVGGSLVVDVPRNADGWALFLGDVLAALRTATGAGCSREHVLVSPIEHFAALDGAALRSAGVAVLRAVLEQTGAARVSRAVVGLGASANGVNERQKRNVLAASASVMAQEDDALTAYVFHLLFWTGLLLAVLALTAVCVMHSLYDVTEKDALLYRNTTSTMFSNTLEMR